MKIVRYPHPALRQPARVLTSIDEQVRTDARRMLELMYESRGVGLAANQVVLPYQMFVMNELADPEQREHEHVLINPVIVERKGWQEGEEGCLSFPELYQTVRRSKMVRVKFYNLKGELVELTRTDLAARVLQHEGDHLAGVLFIEKMGPLARLAARGRLRELEDEFRRLQTKGEIPSDADLKKMLDEMQRGSNGALM